MSPLVETVLGGVLIVVIVGGIPWSIKRWRMTKQSTPWIWVTGCSEQKWAADRAEYKRLYAEDNQLRKRLVRFLTK